MRHTGSFTRKCGARSAGHGYPHQILLDECHYFLDQPRNEALLDLVMDSYTLVTHRPSHLTPNVLKSAQVLVATRFESKVCQSFSFAITAMIGRNESGSSNNSKRILPSCSCTARNRGLSVASSVTFRIRTATTCPAYFFATLA
jgi:hypothetical protein